MKSYCVKQRKETECLSPCVYKYEVTETCGEHTASNRLVFCKCAECFQDKVCFVHQKSETTCGEMLNISTTFCNSLMSMIQKRMKRYF